VTGVTAASIAPIALAYAVVIIARPPQPRVPAAGPEGARWT